MLKFDFSKPNVLLAPMAGLTDAPMRSLVASFGVSGVVSEMLACQEWRTKTPGVAERAERGELPENCVYVVQIAGRDPKLMADVARFAVDQGADHVDINMGCPAKKVTTGQAGGAALLKEPELALEIIETVANAIKIPTTVKTRLGWDAHDSVNIVRDMVNAGAQMLSIHGRTRAQKYDGHADWKAIAAIKERVNVPVISNGDICSLKDAQTALAQSACDGVMIGRASTGQPWLPAQILAALRGEDCPMDIQIPQIALRHYLAMIAQYGDIHGVRVARKHLNGYFYDAPESFRQQMLRSKSHLEVIEMIKSQEWQAAC